MVGKTILVMRFTSQQTKVINGPTFHGCLSNFTELLNSFDPSLPELVHTTTGNVRVCWLLNMVPTDIFLSNNTMIMYPILGICVCFTVFKPMNHDTPCIDPALSFDQIVWNHIASFFDDQIDHISIQFGGVFRRTQMFIPLVMLERRKPIPIWDCLKLGYPKIHLSIMFIPPYMTICGMPHS